MSTWCLIQSQTNAFIKGIQTGEIDTAKMSDMSSEDRHTFLAKFVGEENATQVNSLFESKLLLKNQQAGMLNWANKVSGLSPEVKRDLVSRIQKLDTVLNPADQKKFLKDLATTKLGTDVTQEEAKNIYDLSKKVEDAKSSIQENNTFKTKEEGLKYGMAKRTLENYVNELKSSNTKFSLNPIKIAETAPGIAKSIKATLDDSALLHQGWKTLFTHPLTWQKNALKSFRDIVKEFGGKSVMDQVIADRYSRPNDLNGNYNKMGLALNNPEESFPTAIPEKIPVLGRAYKASESAYTGFLYRQRMDIADKYLEIAQKTGVDLTKNELASIGSMVNSLTGRGNMGKLEGSAINAANNVFFSPRNLKSQWDTVGHVITGAGGSNFVRKQAAINLVKVISGVAAIMTIANAVRPGSAETDPRSSDFGKIKVGDTRFDITGGMSSLITLAARVALNSSKSTATGKVTPINASDKTGKPLYGAKTGHDVVDDFLTNKLSPVASVVNDLINRRDRNNNPVTPQGEAVNFIAPLPITTFAELKNDPNSANIIIAMIADALGLNTNTYSPPISKQPSTPKSGLSVKGSRGLNRKI